MNLDLSFDFPDDDSLEQTNRYSFYDFGISEKVKPGQIWTQEINIRV